MTHAIRRAFARRHATYSNIDAAKGWFVLLALSFTLAGCSGHAGSSAVALPAQGGSGQQMKLQFRLDDSIYATSVAWSPDGRYIATSSIESNLVHVWDVKSRALAREFDIGSSNTNYHDISWSPDSRYLAVCGPDHLHVYRSSDWSEAFNVGSADAAGCERAAFSDDNQQMALLGVSLRIFTVADWRLSKASDLEQNWAKGYLIKAIAYLPGSHVLLLSGGETQVVRINGVIQDTTLLGRVWRLRPEDLEPSQAIQAYRAAGDEGGAGEVISMAISPDGVQIATGTHTGAGPPDHVVTESVHIFRAADGALLGSPLDHGDLFGAQTGLAYTPDGRFIIAGHEDATTRAVHLIDARTLAIVGQVQAGDRVYDIAVNPTSTQFAAATGRKIEVWSLPTGPRDLANGG
jgi:WD40 repeat protein